MFKRKTYHDFCNKMLFTTILLFKFTKCILFSVTTTNTTFVCLDPRKLEAFITVHFQVFTKRIIGVFQFYNDYFITVSFDVYVRTVRR